METRRRIKRLDTEIVNRIAAGEVVKRPANALKEMIENSLDASATSIQVVVKDGGMKYLQIQDNGCGIAKEDLEVVCERFTTSKLEKFDDLQSISTYGFRGEALCSISLVSHVTIVTKTSEERCGYKVMYRDGKMKGLPVPCGANQGTQITIENMFYNVPTRHKMLKNFNEEFSRIKDVVANYAIHNASVSFSLKKYGRDDVFVKTLPNSTSVDNIRSVYGTKIARDLMETKETDDTLLLKYHVLATSLDYHAPQLIFLLFINHRLVEAEGLRKQLDLLYSNYLPQGTHPFIYLSLEMAPENIDVNVHPTKHRVFYLHEEAINNKIRNKVQQLILASQGSSYLPVKEFSSSSFSNPLAHDSSIVRSKVEVVYPHEKVRIDSALQKIDKFLQPLRSDEEIQGSCGDSFHEISGKQSTNTIHVENAMLQDSNSKISINVQCSNTTQRVSCEQQNSVNCYINKGKDQIVAKSELAECKISSSSVVEVVQCGSSENLGCHSERSNDIPNNIGVSTVKEISLRDNVENCIKDVDEDVDRRNSNNSLNDYCKPCSSNSILTGDNSMETLKNVCASPGPSSELILSERREFSLTSLETLRKNVVDNCDHELKRVLRSSTYVGCVEHKYLLMQHGTNLYLCDVQHLCETFFYQVLLCEFGNFGVITLSQPTPLKFLLENTLSDHKSEEQIEILCNRLLDKSEMLEDYFCIKIDKNGNILSFPWLLEKYYPSVEHFPEYILKLATEVNWDEELPCIQGICIETARFYSRIPSKCDNTKITKEWNWTLEHILFPKIKRYVFPPKSFIKSWSLCHIARFKDLFSIFERC